MHFLPLQGFFIYSIYLYRGLLLIMCLYKDLLFFKCLYRAFCFLSASTEPFVYYIPVQGLVVHHVPLLGPFVYYMLLQGLFVYYVPLQCFSFIVCLNKGLFSYLFFFKSVKICLCSSLSRNYVFQLIGLPRFRRVLDSFTNCPTRTSIHARIFKNPNVWLHHSLY